jgi:hypothetical protein
LWISLSKFPVQFLDVGIGSAEKPEKATALSIWVENKSLRIGLCGFTSLDTKLPKECISITSAKIMPASILRTWNYWRLKHTPLITLPKPFVPTDMLLRLKIRSGVKTGNVIAEHASIKEAGNSLEKSTLKTAHNAKPKTSATGWVN